MTNIIETINPMAETKKSFLGVMKVREGGCGNIVVNVNKWYQPGDKINIIKKDNMFIFSKQSAERSIQRTVRKTGNSSVLSLMNIASEGYYSVHKTGKDLVFMPATTEEALHFARKIKRTNAGECLVMQSQGVQVYLKKADLNMFPKNTRLSAEFHRTEDNLMWFEVFAGDQYSEGTVRCGIFSENILNVPKSVFELTGLNAHDVLTCWKNNNRLIVELPNISCETCGTTIRRKTNKSKAMIVSQSTKDACEVVRQQVATDSLTSKQMQFIEALQSVRAINNLLNGGK